MLDSIYEIIETLLKRNYVPQEVRESLLFGAMLDNGYVQDLATDPIIFEVTDYGKKVFAVKLLRDVERDPNWFYEFRRAEALRLNEAGLVSIDRGNPNERVIRITEKGCAFIEMVEANDEK